MTGASVVPAAVALPGSSLTVIEEMNDIFRVQQQSRLEISGTSLLSRQPSVNPQQQAINDEDLTLYQPAQALIDETFLKPTINTSFGQQQ
jgi:hypothetical protein